MPPQNSQCARLVVPLVLAALLWCVCAPAQHSVPQRGKPGDARVASEGRSQVVPPKGVPRFAVETKLVVLHATVMNKQKHLVTDLRREHFKVLENNVVQEIKDFRREDIPVSVGILVDNSGSMRDKRPRVNAAALTFVRTSNRNDEVFIVNFNDEAFLDKDFTSNLAELKEGLEKIDSRGGTAYYDTIRMSLNHLNERGRMSKKVLLVITDGEDNASRVTMERLIKAVQQTDVVIYSIGVLGDDNARAAKRARKAIEAISEATGGAAFFPGEVDAVEGIAVRIAQDIRNQYLLTYKPSNAAADGSYRSVKVKVRAPGKGRLFVRTRTGYYATAKFRSVTARRPGG